MCIARSKFPFLGSKITVDPSTTQRLGALTLSTVKNLGIVSPLYMWFLRIRTFPSM